MALLYIVMCNIKRKCREISFCGNRSCSLQRILFRCTSTKFPTCKEGCNLNLFYNKFSHQVHSIDCGKLNISLPVKAEMKLLA
jgi:hypothetical protein